MDTTDNLVAQSIIDHMHTAIVVIGDQLKIICINPAAEMLFHISNIRAKGRNLQELVLDSPEFYDRLERSLVSGHPYSFYHTHFLLHNQQTIDVDYTVSPLPLDHGRQLVIEFKQLSFHQKHAHEDSIISQYEASKGLLRGLAHEIKNPLGGIRGSAQLLERELGESDENQFTQIIIQETDRLKDLLDRMVGPKEVPNKSAINIHRLLEHVRKLVVAENPEVHITADYDPSIPEFNADESMMIQVLLNLTRNAVTATTEADDRPSEILFRTRTQRNCKIGNKTYPLGMRIDIEDNGAGIDEELQEKIFLPMVTGHADGTGLGLPIAQSLVKQHEGLIEYENRADGTTFSILLPLPNGKQTNQKQDYNGTNNE